MALEVTEVRSSGRSLGSLQASVVRQDEGVEFSVDTPATALHQLSARGRCDGAGHCRAEFSADTAQLATLLRGVQLPRGVARDQPARRRVRSTGPAGLTDVHALGGSFEVSTQGMNAEHQMTARGTLAGGQILLADVQGTGPAPDEVFRGTGRIGLEARDYDVTRGLRARGAGGHRRAVDRACPICARLERRARLCGTPWPGGDGDSRDPARAMAR